GKAVHNGYEVGALNESIECALPIGVLCDGEPDELTKPMPGRTHRVYLFAVGELREEALGPVGYHGQRSKELILELGKQRDALARSIRVRTPASRRIERVASGPIAPVHERICSAQ